MLFRSAGAGRAVTRPEVLDLNEAVRGAGQLLRRTLGEHIDLVIAAEPALWRVKADRGQLEQVLVNLAVNARDSMPDGGRLTIDTGNAEVDAAYATGRPHLAPGRYARLRVSDTGTGMDPATVARSSSRSSRPSRRAAAPASGSRPSTAS